MVIAVLREGLGQIKCIIALYFYANVRELIHPLHPHTNSSLKLVLIYIEIILIYLVLLVMHLYSLNSLITTLEDRPLINAALSIFNLT